MKPSVNSNTRTQTAPDPAKLASMRNEIRLHLEDKRRALAEEIRNYPTPIPRCDAQFNHLYEQQAKLARDLDRIAVPAGKSAKRSNTIALIRQFVASAPYTDDAAERELRSRMKAELSALAENQWSPLLTHKERKSC
jgi:hypothetical protein